MATYKALVGLDYAGKRVEPGDVVSDLPSRSVSWLVEQGLVEKVGSDPVKKSDTKREPESPEKEA